MFVADEFAEEVIPLPTDPPTTAGRKSAESVLPTLSQRKSRGVSANVTFQEGVQSAEKTVVENIMTEGVQSRDVESQTQKELVEPDEDEDELRELR